MVQNMKHMFLMLMYLIWILIIAILFGLTVFIVMNLRYSSNSSALSYRSFLNISLILFVLINVFLTSLIIYLMKEKSNVVDVSSTELLFAKPAPYRDSGEFRKTVILVSVKDDQCNSVISHVCIEDKMKDVINLSYQETTLSNLVDKGISPKTLAIIDTQKLGCDVGVDQLANYIMDHASEFVVTPKSEEK